MKLNKRLNSVWLDEHGLTLGLQRLKDEPLDTYRRRLLLQASRPPEQTVEGCVVSANRMVGLFHTPMFKIDLAKDEDGVNVAPDPRVEINSTHLKVWSDYKNKADSPELDINIYERGEGYFLKDVHTALDALDFITVEIATKDKDTWQYKRSWNLLYGTSTKHAYHVPLSGIRMNDLPHTNIFDLVYSQKKLFGIEVDSHEDIANPGDYYIDYQNGILFTEDIVIGVVSYSYRFFPHLIEWQPIKVTPINDDGFDYLAKDNLLNSDGKLERLILSSYGAKIINDLLAVHPLQWGK